MAKNNIVFRYFLPQIILFGTFAVIVASPVTYGIVTNKIYDKHYTKADKAQNIAISLILFLSIAVLIWPFVDHYKKGEKFASNIVRKYIIKEMAEHPELKDFKDVLSKPKAVENIAIMVSNSLQPEEQARILDIIDKLDRSNFKSKAAEISAIKQSVEQITQIIKEHAVKEPDFIKEIYAKMAYADSIYVIPSQQNVR